jgi:diguanylate cyclase (GGDEF)-like protein
LPIKFNVYIEALIDIFLLAVISTPLIYLWVVQPFVTARDLALEQIKLLAHTDPLTGLANRRLLSIQLEQLIAATTRHAMRGAVLLIDLDGFKAINDVHGHDAGDAVLVEIAQRLRTHIRPEDVAGRLGGDEFVILINNLSADEPLTRGIALQIAEKLVSLIQKPIAFKNNPITLSASIGIRLLGFDALDTDTAFREADLAMYRAKQSGSGRVECYEK